MSLSLIVLHPIYATVYISKYLRALGAKIGKDTEISTASSVTYPLLEIGEGRICGGCGYLRRIRRTRATAYSR